MFLDILGCNLPTGVQTSLRRSKLRESMACVKKRCALCGSLFKTSITHLRMVVCKFFLQGECRFGENCRFEHQFNPEKAGSQQFGNNQYQVKIVNSKTGAEIELSTLLNSVKNDVVSGERGKQWLLTCYAPFKEKSAYPGFIDMSFEEVRFGFIEAQKSNTLKQYNQQLQQLLTEAKLKYKALENPTKEIATLLKNIYNNVSTSGTNNIFGQSGQENGGLKGLFGLKNSSVFGQQNSVSGGNSIFGQQNSSVFGQSGPVNNGSVFGKTQQSASNPFQQVTSAQNNATLISQQQSSNSIFGQKTGSIFGQTQTGGSIFGQQNSSIFNQQSTVPSNANVFAQTNLSSSNIFGQNNPSNVTNQQNTNSLFSQSNSGNVFAKQNIFGQPNVQNTNNNPFGQQNITGNGGSIFGGQKSVQSSGSIFSQQNNVANSTVQSNPAGTGSIFGQASTIQSGGNIFGHNSSQSSNNLFQVNPPNNNQNNANNVFGTQQVNSFNSNPQVGVFGKVQQTSQFPSQNIIPQTTQSGSIFVKTAESINLANQNTNPIFQMQKPQSNSIFGLNPVNAVQGAFNSDKPAKNKMGWGAYSKLEDLNEDEVKWFNNDVFDVYCIPEKPPTYEMCF